MGELFGLGILLTLQDRATRGVQHATSALEDLEQQTRETINAVSDLDRANTGLSSSNPSMTLTEMAQSMRRYTYYYDQYGRRHRYHSNQFNRELMRMTGSANDMAQSLESSIRPWGQIAGMTNSGRQVASMMQGIARETQTAQRALLGFNAEGTRAITAEQTQQALSHYRNTVNDLQASLHGMYQRGEIDALSYQTAVRNMAQESQRIERINERGFRTTSQYYSMLQQAGIATNAIENMRGIQLERNRARIASQARGILEMRTSSSSLHSTFQRMSPVLGSMTQNVLGLGDAIQRASRYFDPLVTQARLFNEGWSGNDVQRYMTSMASFANGFVTVFPMLTLGVVAYYTALGALATKHIPAVTTAWEKFKQSSMRAIDPLIHKVGDIIIAVLKMGTAIMDSITKFEKAHPIITKIAVSLALIIPALTLIVSGLLALKKAGGHIFQAIAQNAMQAGTDLMGVGLAISFIGAVAMNLITTVVIFKSLYENCAKFKQIVDGAVKSVKDFINTFKKNHPTITAFFNNLSFGMLTAFMGVTWLQTSFAILGRLFRPLAGHLGIFTRAFSVLRSVAGFAINFILGLFTRLGVVLLHPISTLRALGGVAVRAFGLVRGALAPVLALLRNFPALIRSAITWLRALPALIIAGFRALPGIIWGALQSVFSRALGLITRFGSFVLMYARNPLLLLRDASRLAQRAVVSAFRGMGVAVRLLGTFLTSPITAIRNLGSAVRGLWGTLATRLPFSPWIIVIGILIAGVMALWKTNENFRNAVTRIWQNICDFVTQVVNGVKQAMEGKLKPVIENLKSILESLGTIFGTIFSAISSVLSVFFGDVTSGFDKTGSAVQIVTDLIVNGLTGAINILNAVLTPLANVLKKVADYMKEHSDEIQNGMMKAYEGLVDLFQAVVTPIIESVTDFWKEHGETITNFVTSVYSGLGSVLSGVVQGALTVIKDLVKVASDFWREHGETITNKVSGAYQNLLPIVSGAVQTFMNIVLDIVGAVTDFWEAHGQEIMQSASTIWNGIVSIVSTAWAFIRDVILPVAGEILMAVINAFSGIASFISSHSATIQQVISFVVQTISTVISIACSIIGGTVQNVFTIIGGIIQAVSQILQGDFSGAWNTICSTVQNVCSTMWDTIVNVFNSIVDYITGIDWLSLGSNVVQGIADGISGGVQWVWDSITNIAQAIKDGFCDFLGIHSPSRVMHENGVYVIQGLVNGITDSVGLVTGAIDRIASLFTQLRDKVSNTVTALVTGVKTKFTGMVNGVKNMIANMVTALVSKFTTLVSQATAKITAFANALRNGAIKAKNYVVNTVTSMINKVKTLGSQFVNIGKNMIQGLVNGVKSKASALITSVTGAVKGAINKAKALLGIHSPSKVFRIMGNQTMEGYNMGVVEEKPSTLRAIEYALPVEQDFEPREFGKQLYSNNYNNTNTANTNTTNNNRVSNDTINFNIQVADGKSFTMEDAERIFDMLQKVKDKRDLFVYN